MFIRGFALLLMTIMSSVAISQTQFIPSPHGVTYEEVTVEISKVDVNDGPFSQDSVGTPIYKLGAYIQGASLVVKSDKSYAGWERAQLEEKMQSLLDSNFNFSESQIRHIEGPLEGTLRLVRDHDPHVAGPAGQMRAERILLNTLFLRPIF